jgi:hypothetical protein
MRRQAITIIVLALAMALAAATVSAQSVQLPTFSFATVGTTVVVPDGGSAFLGGINRAETGRSEFGTPMLDKIPFLSRPFKNTGIGQTRNASSFHVTAKIHDFDAMEEALLGVPPSQFTSSNLIRPGDTKLAIAGQALQPRNPAALAGAWAPRNDAVAAAAGSLNLADEQSRRAAQQQTRSDEAERFFERARQAEADGKPSVARIYYQMVARRASGELKSQAMARLGAISGASSGVAQAAP